MRLLERIPEHYDEQETEFGCTYRWHPELVVVQCSKCGKRKAFTRAELIAGERDCECGMGHSAKIREEVIAQLLDEDHEAHHHPWRYWHTNKDSGIPY